MADKKFFDSKNVSVFPCAYRGIYTNGEKQYSFDPESKLTTEANFVHSPNHLPTHLLTDNTADSYIIEWDAINNILVCSIKGYYFKISNIELTQFKPSEGKDKAKQLYICLGDHELVSSSDSIESTRTTQKLLSLDQNNPGSLDVLNTDGTYSFTGLLISDSKPAISGEPYSLQAFIYDNGEIKINSAKFLPWILSGSADYKTPSLITNSDNVASGSYSFASGYKTSAIGEASFTIGSANNANGTASFAGGYNSTAQNINSFAFGNTVTADNENQFTIGKYNAENNNALFVIGAGENTNKWNVFTVSQTAITSDNANWVINNATNITFKSENYKFTTLRNGYEDNAYLTIIDTAETPASINLFGTNIDLTSKSATAINSNKINLLGQITAQNTIENTASSFNLEKSISLSSKNSISAVGNLNEITGNTSTTIYGNTFVKGITTIDPSTGKSTTTTPKLKVIGNVEVENGNIIAKGSDATFGQIEVNNTATINKATILKDTLSVTGTAEFNNKITAASGQINSLLLNNNSISTTIKSDGIFDCNLNEANKQGSQYSASDLLKELYYLGNPVLSFTVPDPTSTAVFRPYYTSASVISEPVYRNWWNWKQGNETNLRFKCDQNCSKIIFYISRGFNIHNKTSKVAITYGAATLTVTAYAKNGTQSTSKTYNYKQIIVDTDPNIIVGNNNYGQSEITIENSDSFIDHIDFSYTETVDDTNHAAGFNFYKIKCTLGLDNTIRLLGNYQIGDTSDDKLTIKSATALASTLEVAGKTTLGASGTTTTTDLKVYGQIEANSFNATSDRRLKENIKEYTCNKSILDLPIYKYDFINGEKNQIGCIAQDLKEICPEIVKENEEGYLSIQESKIVYLLLEEVKKLKERVDELEGK